MKLTQIQTHESIFIPGLGNLKNTINHEPQKGTTLTIVDGVGVMVTFNNKFALIPWNNVKSANGMVEKQ